MNYDRPRSRGAAWRDRIRTAYDIAADVSDPSLLDRLVAERLVEKIKPEPEWPDTTQQETVAKLQGEANLLAALTVAQVARRLGEAGLLDPIFAGRDSAALSQGIAHLVGIDVTDGVRFNRAQTLAMSLLTDLGSFPTDSPHDREN